MNETQNDDAKKQIDAQMGVLYQDLIENIRVTDDISFKLLGTVPLLSGVGSGALSLLKSGHGLNDYTVLALSLIGCTITFGLLTWELRNIQRCTWFISRAAQIERRWFPRGDIRQFNGFFSNDEHLNADNLDCIKIRPNWKQPWRKTNAEILIYSAAIVAWLIPFGVSIASLSHLTSR